MPTTNAEACKKYRENNKEKIKERRESEKNKEYMKEYRNSAKGKKSTMISGWKYKGLISDDYDAIYDRYINTHECDCCKKPIHQGKGSRVMDHDHNTGKFRNVLCHDCNILRYHLDNNYQAYLKMMTL